MTNFENSVLKLDELPRDDKILTGRTAHCKDDDGNARKYNIGEKLGEGGMGVVYQGVDETGQKVALKFLKYKESKLVKALKKESKLMAAIEHQNILKVLGFYEDVRLEGDGKEPMPMMVTEYIDGLKALDVTNVGKNFCKYTVQIFNGLEAIHDRGLIHRDVKPGNILVTPDGDVKISDFGLSAIIDEHTGLALSMSVSMQDTSQKGIAGTRGYLPKNIEELKNPDKRTDLYSLGLVWYQMILGDTTKFPDTRASARAEKAAKEKNLPLPAILADLVSSLALEERSERPADIAAIKTKERELYTAIEDEAGLPVYWAKFCEAFKHIASRTNEISPQKLSEIDQQLKSLDKDKRIEGAVQIIRQLPYSLYERTFTDGLTGLLNNWASFLDLREKPAVHPKNKDDAEFVIQAIKYCLENDKHIRIDHRMDYLMNWENKIKEYQSKFGINAAETLGILGKVVEGEQESLFTSLREEILRCNATDINTRILKFICQGKLTQDHVDKLDALLDKPKNTEAKNKPEYAPQSIEDIKEKYKKFADSLEGKTVTQEFKEAFAFAAYKEGVSREYIDEVLLNTIERVRKKRLLDRIKWKIPFWDYGLADMMQEPADARADTESLLVPSVYNRIPVATKLDCIIRRGRTHNIFVGDLIEKVCVEYADYEIKNNRVYQEQITNFTKLGHKYGVNLKPVLDNAIDKFNICKEFRFVGIIANTESVQKQLQNEFYTALQQKYPDAFKEAPKFEDLEKMIEETPKLKDLEKIVETEPKEEFSVKDSVVKVIIALEQYIMGGMVGTFAGFMSDLALYGLSGGAVTLLGCGAGLGTVFGLRTYNAWKKARKAVKEKLQEQAIASEEGLPKDLNKLLDIVTPENVSNVFPAMLKVSYPPFENLARAVKCPGGVEIKGIDRQQIGEEVRKYTLRYGKQKNSYLEKDCHMFLKQFMDNESLIRDLDTEKNIGVITRFDVSKDFFRKNYFEMDITIYEKKNKIDEKIEKKEDLTDKLDPMTEKPSFLWHNEQGLKYGPSRDEERDLMTEKPKPFSSLEKQVKAKATEEPKPESEPIQKEPEQSIPVQEEPKQTLQSPVQEQEDDEDDDEDERMLEQ